MKKVLILMSTYNGEKYVKDQLNSILEQEDVTVSCLIRDDGSKDSTISIIKDYLRNNKNIKLLNSKENIGCAKSFYELVKNSDKADYYAFSDQDDLWYRDKLISAVNKIIKYEDIPCVYYSNLELINERNEILGNRYKDNPCDLSKGHSLVENFATGCTMVFNNKAKELLLSYEPNFSVLHDFWLYILCTYMGKTIYDPNPHIKYRQHSNNVVGARMSIKSIWKARYKTLRSINVHPREMAAKDLLQGYNNLLDVEDKKQINDFACYRKTVKLRMKLLLNKSIKMQIKENDFWYRMHIVFGNL